MVRKQKKKAKTKKGKKPEAQPVSTDEILSKSKIESENIVRLKLTTRKGTRIESVPAKKLEKVSKNKKLYWNLKGEWLVLVGLSN